MKCPVPLKKKKILLCGGDPCCNRLDLGFDNLDPAGRVNGLDCLEEISGDLSGYDPVEERCQVPCACLGCHRFRDCLSYGMFLGNVCPGKGVTADGQPYFLPVFCDKRDLAVHAGAPALDERAEVVPGYFVTNEFSICRIPGHGGDLKAHLHVLFCVIIQDLAECCLHDPADNALSIVCYGVTDIRLAEIVGDVHLEPAFGLPAFYSSSNLFFLCHGITWRISSLVFSLTCRFPRGACPVTDGCLYF